MSLNQQAITGNREITALLTQVQELNFELHVRDTPDLLAKFGPGAD
ncbi:hypothetical protein [Microbacterium paulum]